MVFDVWESPESSTPSREADADPRPGRRQRGRADRDSAGPQHHRGSNTAAMAADSSPKSAPTSSRSTNARASSNGANSSRPRKRASFREDELRGKPGPASRRPQRPPPHPRHRPGCARRQSHRPHLHRRPLRRLALRLPHRNGFANQPTSHPHRRRPLSSSMPTSPPSSTAAQPNNKPTPKSATTALPTSSANMHLRLNVASSSAWAPTPRRPRPRPRHAPPRPPLPKWPPPRIPLPTAAPPSALSTPASQKHLHRQTNRRNARRRLRPRPRASSDVGRRPPGSGSTYVDHRPMLSGRPFDRALATHVLRPWTPADTRTRSASTQIRTRSHPAPAHLRLPALPQFRRNAALQLRRPRRPNLELRLLCTIEA